MRDPMLKAPPPGSKAGGQTSRYLRTRDALRSFFQAERHMRRGICFLNGGQFDRAIEELTKASAANPDSVNLPRFLVAALVGAKRYNDAAQVGAEAKSRAPTVAAAIRRALLEFKSGRARSGIAILRDAVAANPECAELHFQLGTLLAALDENEEAELRFTQAIAIDNNHADALVGLALCFGVRNDPCTAMRYLERAQHLRPADARIALLLSTAAKARRQTGDVTSVRASMPDAAEVHDGDSIEELSKVLERDPEFADAFLSLEIEDVDESVFRMLAETLQRAIERHPQQAYLHYQCGRTLRKLGREQEAIVATERAVDLDPRCVQALIELARLYQHTDRREDAMTRLEQTIRLGAEYADTYLLLGNLYRDTGQIDRARWAYENALRINDRYEEARKALDTLAA